MKHCWIHTSEVVRRQHLRSADCRQLLVPRYRCLMFARRAFSVAGPAAWNSLPDYLRVQTCSILLTIFVLTWKLFSSRSTSVQSALGALRFCAIQIYYWHWHWVCTTCPRLSRSMSLTLTILDKLYTPLLVLTWRILIWYWYKNWKVIAVCGSKSVGANLNLKVMSTRNII